ncbi:2-hydroxyacyl-CoA dehydratase subunit D [Chloroflexota bacterium]
METTNGNSKNGLLDSLNIILQQEPQRITEAKKRGKKVVGYFCPYGTEELILAAGMLPVRLAFGGEVKAVSAGEEFLKAYSCTFALSCLGYKILAENFYYNAVDAVCVAHTYDSMRIVQQYWEKYFNIPALPLGLPQTHSNNRAKPQAIEYFRSELELLRKRLGALRGRKITETEIRKAITLCNKIREKLLILYSYPQGRRSPIEWRQVLKITQAGFLIDRGIFLKELENIEEALRHIKPDDIKLDERPRLMIIGSIIGIGDEKLLDIIEQSGGNIVADSICTGSMFSRKKVPVFGVMAKPIDTLAQRYLYNVPCPFMTDQSRKLKRIIKIARDYKVHGIIFYSLKHNETWRSEFKPTKDNTYRELSIPSLHIATDYSLSDTAAIKDRIAAFMKLIGG